MKHSRFKTFFMKSDAPFRLLHRLKAWERADGMELLLFHAAVRKNDGGDCASDDSDGCGACNDYCGRCVLSGSRTVRTGRTRFLSGLIAVTAAGHGDRTQEAGK